jgi:hypothetical protein
MTFGTLAAAPDAAAAYIRRPARPEPPSVQHRRDTTG